jgi:hypothetical protein
MLESLHESFQILAQQAGAHSEQLSSLLRRYPNAPKEYLELVSDATEIELQHEGGQYIRIWGPAGCIEMDDANDISERITGAFPVGDDGGGKVILYMNGKHGPGVYHVGFGDLDAEDTIFAASSLTGLLCQAVGIETFYRNSAGA